MTRPLTLQITGDVGDVSSLSDSSLGSLGSWSATGSQLLVSPATSLDNFSCNGVSCVFRIIIPLVSSVMMVIRSHNMILVRLCQISLTAGFQVRLCHTLILSLSFNDSRDVQLRSKYFF